MPSIGACPVAKYHQSIKNTSNKLSLIRGVIYFIGDILFADAADNIAADITDVTAVFDFVCNAIKEILSGISETFNGITCAGDVNIADSADKT